MNAPPKAPKIAQPKELARWSRDREGKQIFIIGFDSYEGHDFLSLRLWFKDADGELRPSKKGIAFSARHLPKLFEALRAAYRTARETGLIEGPEK